MKLTKEQVEHIAMLARLGLTAKEKEKFRDQLSSILDYVEKLNEVDTKEVAATAHATGLENVMRTDKITASEKETMSKLIQAAPVSERGLVKTRGVFE